MAVSKRVRFEVLRRDGHRCRYCGASAAEVKLTVDHVVPEALGGSDDPSNLVAACMACNAGKTSTNPDDATVAQVRDDALRWARAMQQAADEAAQARAELADQVAAFAAVWDSWQVGDQPVPKSKDWALSIQRWLAAGLTIEDLTALVPAAMGSKASVEMTWRYFAGCAWNELRERQDRAHQILGQHQHQDDDQDDDLDLDASCPVCVGRPRRRHMGEWWNSQCAAYWWGYHQAEIDMYGWQDDTPSQLWQNGYDAGVQVGEGRALSADRKAADPVSLGEVLQAIQQQPHPAVTQ